MDLLFDVSSRMIRLRDVPFKCQAHQLSTFTHRRHCQQSVNVRGLLKSQADSHGDLGTDFRRFFRLCRHRKFQRQD
ncbi:hypothetical protein [Massilia aerilata]|uniref:Uncharacterized protein n=1 Tax=Massilia aerilata TaxID=453817 RepID=A0ABW0S677_9BURK